jgi:hypothetical protein
MTKYAEPGRKPLTEDWGSEPIGWVGGVFSFKLLVFSRKSEPAHAGGYEDAGFDLSLVTTAPTRVCLQKKRAGFWAGAMGVCFGCMLYTTICVTAGLQSLGPAVPMALASTV